MLGMDIHRTRRVARRLAITVAIGAVGIALLTAANRAQTGGDHSGHDHGPPAAPEQGAANQPSDDIIRRHGIVVAEVGLGELGADIVLPGEIKLNEDRVAHLAPRIGGVAQEIYKTVGDEVKVGDRLALLESAELGEAKADYLAKLNEVGCCKVLVPRLQAVHQNTRTLLQFLDRSPTREQLREFADLPMGGNRSKLIGSYSEVLLARRNHSRERTLHEKEIASEQDLLGAENALGKAESHYTAERDTIAFETEIELAEALAELRRAEFELKQAERHLHFLGIGQEEIRYLAELVTGPSEGTCPDPDCADCRATDNPEAKAAREARKAQTEAGLTRHTLTAPTSGMIIERHIALGEHVNLESDVFTIAGLSTVWVDLRVHERDLPAVGKGQAVTIRGRPGLPETRGTVDFVHPIVDPETRTALARVVLENPEGRLRPGTFVTAIVAAAEEVAEIIVPKDAVQYTGDQPVVFVEEGGEFKLREIILGEASGSMVQIVFGLQAGERIAVKNSFRLKAELARLAAGDAACSSPGHTH
jgi:membrane fusion protein, heavy metal efflux system